MEKNTRRKALKSVFLGAAIALGLTKANAEPKSKATKKVTGSVIMSEDKPLFSSAVKHGNLLFIAGKGAHFEGDITAHTEFVLNDLKNELEKNGSSMEKVLKVNVYLADLQDYQAMNAVYRGKFGDHPPVRTTVATYGGVPGNSLVEIDCIASLD